MGFEFRKFAESYFESLVQTVKEMPILELEEFWQMVETTRESGATVHFIGNGGSAGTPSHSAGDWSKELALRTISHVDNTPSLTAWANDTEYQNVFAGQLSTFLRDGDIVVGFSGSGNSENVLRGIELAKERGCSTVAVTGDYNGMAGGKLAELADIAIIVPSQSMERIEDMQLIINHIVKEAVKENNGL
ncbi:MAG TPA: SIS domain-containing protein [Candidatus Thalassarchaeaceae archaeon]|jgi:D-sedoheptulose 7-phosphate isomerase|nr:SIS domain-containing protein [Candidatus Thalassarchaeaceae archaeon]|tara:strand:+ start:22830 stop:23399 length:570 start_codon:yes stop_codon:yes gene_type:complete